MLALEHPRAKSFRVPIVRFHGANDNQANAAELQCNWRWSTEEEEFLSALSGQYEVLEDCESES